MAVPGRNSYGCRVMKPRQWYLLLIVLLKLLSLGEAASNRNRKTKYDRAWKAKKRECERHDCAHLIPDEAANCVNECTSKDCYDDIYSVEPLEDGEIDLERARSFMTCLRNEQRDYRYRGKKKKKKDKNGKDQEADSTNVDEKEGSGAGDDKKKDEPAEEEKKEEKEQDDSAGTERETESKLATRSRPPPPPPLPKHRQR